MINWNVLLRNFLCLIMVLLLSACGSTQESDTPATNEFLESAQSMESAETTQSVESVSTQQEDNSIKKISITIGNQQFIAKMNDNDSARVFENLLPLTIDMSELNGNEKYYYFSQGFPVNASKPSQIHAGDIMLYGTDCLVLFYQSFSSSYSYTSLGTVEDTTGLAQAVGRGNVAVTFSIIE